MLSHFLRGILKGVELGLFINNTIITLDSIIQVCIFFFHVTQCLFDLLLALLATLMDATHGKMLGCSSLHSLHTYLTEASSHK